MRTILDERGIDFNERRNFANITFVEKAFVGHLYLEWQIFT